MKSASKGYGKWFITTSKKYLKIQTSASGWTILKLTYTLPKRHEYIYRHAKYRNLIPVSLTNCVAVVRNIPSFNPSIS